MLAFLKSRAFLSVLGLLFLAVCIVYFGPYLAFGSEGNLTVPFGTLTAQAIAIAVLVALWAALMVIARMRANRASDQLIAGVVAQKSSGKEPPSPEAQQLRERFEEAVAVLKQKRRSGHSLYELPWYVIIGAPGSGKTTALVNSGLNFPLEQRTGKGALRGVGGTRNCDWWFTDEAVLLDTAGRYTTQDSDAASDSAGWVEFLALLRKYRKRRPLNGVILTISAQDLLTQGPDGQEAHVLAVRQRLDELNKQLRIQLPVYLLVTKCDLIAGFTEYFDDLTQEGRAQVWGVTFPYEQTVKGGAAEAYPAEFDALIQRLNDRLFPRLEEETDVRRRTKIFAFPQQLAAIKDALTGFVSEVFSATRFDRKILFRGVYFTSGTQVGNPIDRLLGAIGRRFAIAPDAVASPSGKGRAYFIQRLLKDVLFAESGLAGVDRRAEALKATTQLGVYVAIAVAVVVCVTTWSVSYARNHAYLTRMSTQIAAARAVAPATAEASLEQVVSRLDAVSSVVDAARQGPSRWSMGWGLYQVPGMVEAARTAYTREASVSLLPRIADLFHRRLMSTGGRADFLYAWLKAYLMLTEPEHMNKTELGNLADMAWEGEYGGDSDLRNKLSRHFHTLLERPQGLGDVRRDDSAVRAARTTLAQVSMPSLIYLFIRSQSYTNDDLQIDLIGADKVMRRRDGSRLSGSVPGFFTKKVFGTIASTGTDDLVKLFRRDDWVWGDKPPVIPVQDLKAKVFEQYETDYINYWLAFVDDVRPASLSGLPQSSEAFQVICGPTSPLRAFLKIADEQTSLTKPPEAAPAGTSTTDTLTNLLRPRAPAAARPAVDPGAKITERFAFLRKLLNGSPSPLEQALEPFCQMQKKVQAIGPGVGGTDSGNPQTIRAVSEDVSAVKQNAALLPPSVAAVVTHVASSALDAVRGDVSLDRETKYQRQVVQQCTDLIADRYPFSPAATRDVKLKDFVDVFGRGGVYDEFFTRELAQLVDTNQQPWAWKPGGVQSSSPTLSAMLRRFDDANRIKEIFLGDGGKLGVPLTVSPDDVADSVGRVTLEIEGRNLEYRNGPTTEWDLTWPGPGPEGITITLTATETAGGARTVLPTFTGPWAWFKLLNAGKPVNRGGQEQTVIRLGNDKAWINLKITARSVRNPLHENSRLLLQQFQCQ